MARTFFSSIHGGESTTPFATLNLGDHVGDVQEAVDRNRQRVRELLGLRELIFMNQVHGCEVVEIGDEIDAVPTCDALVTRRKGVGLAVLTADCIPLLIDGGEVVAAVHVGRKGLITGVISETIKLMRQLGARSFEAKVGPSICGDCYEVSPEMYREISAAFPATATDASRHCLNLGSGAVAQLQEQGVRVNALDICTLESQDFFSYRRDEITGRMAGIISL